MTTIWSYGFINLDIITQTIPEWPEQGISTWVDRMQFKIGGVALNPAAAVARLGGLPVGLIGYIGNDVPGQIVRQELKILGLDTTRLVVDDTLPTGTCIVAVHPDTERTFITCAGVNQRLQTEKISIEGLSEKDFFHVGGAGGLTNAPELLQEVQAQGATTSMDVSFDKSGQWWSRLAPVFPYLDIFLANALEADRLTGTNDPQQAVRKIAAAGPELVIVKLGREGAYLYTPTWEGYIQPFLVEAVDTTGAGDSFAGSLLYGLAKGWSIEQAATFANAVGALSTQTAGATEGVRSYAETLAFMATQNRLGDWDWA
ncbi:MAG: carbohydrate kinase family protein [Chloroflexota bacterium]